MLKDECILVDEQDRITGHANKYQSHRCVRWWGAGVQGAAWAGHCRLPVAPVCRAGADCSAWVGGCLPVALACRGRVLPAQAAVRWGSILPAQGRPLPQLRTC